MESLHVTDLVSPFSSMAFGQDIGALKIDDDTPVPFGTCLSPRETTNTDGTPPQPSPSTLPSLAWTLESLSLSTLSLSFSPPSESPMISRSTP